MNKELEQQIENAVDRAMFKNKNNGISMGYSSPLKGTIDILLLVFWFYVVTSFL
mgnify:FL=1